mmetsp:Transcript_36071/g.41819  ORF Transcript_36071/g.41819 Transcript_36071/m.41819 type:complete len:130 (-) Transcript_36071:144-533(-)
MREVIELSLSSKHVLNCENESIVDDVSNENKEKFLNVSSNQAQSATKHKKQEEFQQCNSCLEPEITTSGVVSDERGNMKVQNEHTSGQDSSSSCPSDNTSIPHHQPLHYSVQSMRTRNNVKKRYHCYKL